MTDYEQALNDPREQRHYLTHDTFVRRVIVFVLRTIFSLFMILEAEGVENLPEEGAVILAANHNTNFDIFPMQFSIPRPIFFMGKASLFKNPIINYLFGHLGAFPVYRGGGDVWALFHSRRLLDRGQVLGMFPEGTRSHGKGLGVAKTGAARLAIEKQCPIVPMALIGTTTFFRELPRRNRVRVILCPPIYPKPEDDPLELTDRIMYTLAEALPPDMRGVYADIAEGFAPFPRKDAG